VIRGKEITYYINRIECPSELSQKIRHGAFCLNLFFINKSGLRRMFYSKIFFLIILGCIWFEVSHSVYQFIDDENDSREAFKRSASVDMIWITRRDRTTSGHDWRLQNQQTAFVFNHYQPKNLGRRICPNIVRNSSSKRASLDASKQAKTIRSCLLPAWPNLHENLVSQKHESANWRQL